MQASVALPVAEVLPFYPTQADYLYALRKLAEFGHVPGVALKPLQFRALLYVAGQQRGLAAHQATMGEAVEVGHDAMHDALQYLAGKRDDGRKGPPLVSIDAMFGGDAKPWARKSAYDPSRTFHRKINQYWLTYELLERLRTEDARRARLAAERRDKRALTEPPPTPSPPARTPRAPRPDVRWAEPDIQALAAAFEALELPRRDGEVDRLGSHELQALRNRVAEGCTLDELRGALSGASETCWQRQGAPPWAGSPFAVIFKNPDSVRTFARKASRLEVARPVAEDLGATSPPELPPAPASAPRLTSSAPSSMTASEPSSTRSVVLSDPEPTYQDRHSGSTEGQDRSGLPAARVASGTPRSADAARAGAMRLPPNGLPPPPRGGNERREGEGEHEKCQRAAPSEDGARRTSVADVSRQPWQLEADTQMRLERICPGLDLHGRPNGMRRR